MSDLVSIIITNYNYGEYLAEAIESALGQSYPNLEVIVIDDGSSDNSIEIASQYDVLVLQQPNQGVCAARNNAVKYASGKYIMFLDADDVLCPDTVDNLKAGLDQAPSEVAYSYGQFEYFGFKNGIFKSRPFCAKALSKDNFICITTLMKKSVFEQVRGFDLAFPCREDWELYVRLFHEGYVGHFVEKVILKYRKHKEVERKRFNKPKNLLRTKMFLKFPGFFLSLFFKKIHKCAFYMVTEPDCWKLGQYQAQKPAQVVKALD